MTPLSPGIPLANGNTIHGLAGTAAVIAYTLLGVEVNPGGDYQNKVLAQGILALTDAVMYVVASGNQACVSQLILANTSNASVPGIALAINGPATTAGNQIIASLTIPAYGTAVLVDGVMRVYDQTGQLLQTGTATFDTTAAADTTPIAEGTAGTSLYASHRDHTHQSPGGVAAIVAATAGINTVQVQVVGATIPANLLQAGTVLRFKAFATVTSTVDNVITFRVRIGPTTLTGNIPASLAAHPGNSGTTTAALLVVEVVVTIRTAGASGTAYGFGYALSVATGAAVTQALENANALFTGASVAVDTTVANIAEFTCITAGATSTLTFQAATIEVVKI